MTNDNDTLLFSLMEDIANPVRFRMDGRDETDNGTTMYFTAFTDKEAQRDDR